MKNLLAPNGKPTNLNPAQYELVRTDSFKKWFGDWENDLENSSKIIDENGEPLVAYHGTNRDFNVFDKAEITSNTGNAGHYGEGFYFSFEVAEAKTYTDRDNPKILTCFLNIRNPFDAININHLERYAEEFGFEKKNVAVDSEWLKNELKSIDLIAYRLYSLILEKGYSEGWELFLNEYPDGVNQSKFDLNEISDIAVEWSDKESDTEIPDYILEYLESYFQKEPKLIKNYTTGDEPRMIYMTDYGQSAGYVTELIRKDGFDGIIAGSEIVLFNSNQIKLADGSNTTFNPDSDDIRFDYGGAVNSGLLAPNGQPSNLNPDQYKLVRTEAFKNWFGDWENNPDNSSKAIDSNGEPLVVYHGSEEYFNKFEENKNVFTLQTGFYFSSNKNVSKMYGNIVSPFFINVKDVTVYDAEGKSFGEMIADFPSLEDDLMKQGTVYIDGVIIENVYDSPHGKQIGEKANTYCVYDSHNIKLADGKNTTFDSSREDIRYKGGGSIDNTNMEEKEELITIDKVENTPAGGVLIGKSKEGQTIIPEDGTMGGFLIGRLHKENGIKAINKSNGQPLEMQGNEVVITAPAVADQSKRQFEGKMMTNREILSKINSDGGGVSFADGGEIPAKIHTSDKQYDFEGQTSSDIEIAYDLGFNSTLNNGNQVFTYNDTIYYVANISKAIANNEIDYTVKNVSTFPMKYDIYDKHYSENVSPDFDEPQGIMVLLTDGEEILIDGNHRMNNAYLNELKEIPVNYVSIEAITNFGKPTDSFASGGNINENPPKVKLAIINKIKKIADRIQEIYSYELGNQEDPFSYKGDLSFKERNKLFLELEKLENELNKVTGELSQSQCYTIKSENFQGLNCAGDYGYEEEEFADGGNINNLIAPNGKPSNLSAIQYNLVRTEAFKNWFGDWENSPESSSKVVDINGEPLVVYHGSGTEFYTFDKSKAHDNEGRKFGVGTGKGVFSFTSDIDNAEGWTERAKERGVHGVSSNNPKVLSVFLNFKNPVDRDVFQEKLNEKFKGYSFRPQKERDRFIKEIYAQFKKEKIDGLISDFGEYTAFEPNQIKLADGSNTTFHKEYNDIRYADGGHLSKGKSLEDIAEMHDVSLLHIEQQIKMGLEVEKEHTSNRQQAYRIAKDHLVENPDYYTILKKAGLENGGQLYNSNPFMDYSFGKIKDFLKEQNDIDLKEDWTFVHKGENFTISPPFIHIAKNKEESNIISAPFVIYDYEEIDVAEITFDPNANEDKNLIANSDFFNWNNISFAKGGKLDLVKDSKRGDSPARDLNNYNDVVDVQEDGVIGNHQDFNDGDAGGDASGVAVAFADGGEIINTLDEEKLKHLLNQKIKYETITTRSKKFPFLNLYKYKDYGINFGFKNKEDKITVASKELVLCNDFDFKAPYYFICYESSKHNQISNQVLITTDYKTLPKAISEIFDAEFADCYVYKNNTSEFVDSESIDSIYQIYPKDQVGVVIDKWVKNQYSYEYGQPEKTESIIKEDIKNTQDMNDNEQNVTNWNDIPSVWKDTSKIKKVTWINSPYDKGLYSIIEPFIGKDDLRPNMEGINFDKNGITATDGHKMITLPYPNSKYEGIYKSDLSKKKEESQITIEAKFPNYEYFIPKLKDVTSSYEISVYKLLQYTKVAVKYADKIKHQIAFKIAENKIGFDGNYLTEVLISLLKLGHEKVWVHYTNPNRAFIFTVKQEYELGNDEIVLLMPLNLTEGQQERLQTGISFGTLDADSNRQLSVYYDFATDEIYNADGSIAEFKMNYKNNVVIPEEDVKLLKKLTTEKRHSNNSMLVQVENKTALAVSDELRDYIRLKDIDLSAGLYNVVDAVLEPTMTPVEDYPEVPSFVEDENTIELTIDSEVLEYYFDKLKLAVSKDDLRPVMKGILLHYTTDHRLYLVATDAHIMLKIELTDYVEMRKYDFEAKYILNPKYINMFLDNVENHSLFISSNRKATLIESAKADLYSENIVGNYPNYNGVIPYFLDKKITFNLSDIKKCINGEKVKSYTKSNGSKYSADVIFNDGNKLKIGHSASVTGGVIENVEDLCDIDISVSNQEYQYRNDSVLLSMPFLDRSKEYDFAFNKGNLTRITDIIVDEKVEMHYIDDNKPYIIPIHSISFDKTQKTSKKKEQKPTQKEIDRVIEEDRIQQEHNELGDAIDILHLLSDSASDEERAEINEALEILEMLQEEAPIFEEGGSIEPLNELSYVSNEFGNTTIDTPLETLK